jgi:hypothetical protein
MSYSGLVGTVNGTNRQVNTKDEKDREQAIKDLALIKGFDLRSNPTEYKIDLLHNDRRGGCDVESSNSKNFIRNLTPISYNQFTLPVPTANISWRKEHFMNYTLKWISLKGKYMNSEYEPEIDFEHNSLWRYTRELYSEAFFIDYETYKNKIYKTGLPNTAPWGDTTDRGLWTPGKIYNVDEFGNKVPEYWMCWELKDIEIWVKENGIWRRDTTFDDPKVYKDFVDNYRIAREKYLNANKK